MIEDIRLIRRLRHGDTEALKRIYEKYKNTLMALAVSLCRDQDTAGDILHDVFTAFARRAPELKIKTSLKSYLATSVANRTRNLFRSPAENLESIEDKDFQDENSPEPHEQAILDADAGKVDEALTSLPYPQREVIVLHISQELTFKTIAKHLNESINTIQSRYRYGIKKLRSILTREVYND